MLKAPFHHIAVTVVILTATLTATRLTAHRKIESLSQPLSSIALEIDGFTGSENPVLSPEVLRELKASGTLSRTYRKEGIMADLFIAYYAQQRAGESMHSPKHCLPGTGWEIWDYGTAIIHENGRQVQVNKYSIRRESNRALVLYWYQSKDRIIASEYLGKVLLARDALIQNSTAASIVRIIVPDSPGVLEAVVPFAAEVIPQVQMCFGK